MYLASVIGRVWATHKLEDLEGMKLLLLQPLELTTGEPCGSPIVAADSQQAGQPGEQVYYVTSREASFPFDRRYTALDAAVVGHVDRIDL